MELFRRFVAAGANGPATPNLVGLKLWHTQLLLAKRMAWLQACCMPFSESQA